MQNHDKNPISEQIAKRIKVSQPSKWTIPFSLSQRKFVVILFSGSSGSGKNYIADVIFSPWLIKYRGLYPCSLSFASPLKVGSLMNHPELSWTEVFETKPLRVRKALQTDGVEARERKGPDHWIDQLHSYLLDQLSRGIEVVMITDGRFDNEIDYVKHTFPDNSLTIRLNAPNRVRRKLERDYTVFKEDGTVDMEATQREIELIGNHVSEKQVQGRTDWDLVLQNDEEDESTVASTLMTGILGSGLLARFD